MSTLDKVIDITLKPNDTVLSNSSISGNISTNSPIISTTITTSSPIYHNGYYTTNITIPIPTTPLIFTLFGKEIILSDIPNPAILVSLINLMGVKFWDEYKKQSNIDITITNDCLIIEDALKSHRRDNKIDSIIDKNNKDNEL